MNFQLVTTMLASPDPYNTTETVELCWDDFAMDWALGEIRVRCGLRMFVRTASRYDDSRVLYLPDLKLRIVLGKNALVFFKFSKLDDICNFI